MKKPVFQIRRLPKLVDFMLARIEEEEAIAGSRGRVPHQIHVWDLVGTYNDRCSDCLGLPGTIRLRAECETKRAILKAVEAAERTKGLSEYSAGYRDCCYMVLRAAAAAYKDHPDHQQEWNLTP